MIKALLIHAALIGQSCRCIATRRLHVSSHHVLGFVGTRQTSASFNIKDQRRRVFDVARFYNSQVRYFGVQVSQYSTELSTNDAGLMYDSDVEDDEEDQEESPESENEPSRSYLLHKALFKAVEISLKNLNKKTTSLQRELEKAQSLEETMWRANLIVSNLYQLPPGTTSIEVEDWENDGKIVELVLNTKEYSSAQEESDALFALARKMKRGSKVVGDLLKESLDAEEYLKDGLVSLAGFATLPENVSFDDIVEKVEIDEGELVLIQEKLERTSKKTGFKSPNLESLLNNQGNESNGRMMQNKKVQKETRYKPNPRELISPNGHRVLVGRNRRDNEAICFSLSRPTDIWMHSRGCPGAHVLLCRRRGSPEVTEDDLQFAADLAVFYSDARTERRAPVTTAEPKHITKPRGAPPGAVSLRQEGKTLMGRPEMVSDDLKEAREQSGGMWDEMGYRKDGTRSRNKKRTAAVEKATREKKRQEANAKNKRKARKEESDWY